MRYVITHSSSSGTTGTVEGKTPLSALNALGRDRWGKTHKGAWAVEYDDEGARTQGYIMRDGRTAYFEADAK